MCLLNNFCCCCSLKTGVRIICLSYVIWYIIEYNNNSIPYWNALIPNWSLSYSTFSIIYNWYNAIGASAGVVASLGIYMKKKGLLIPLIMFDSIRFFLVLSLLLMRGFRETAKNSDNIERHKAFLLIAIGFQMYALLTEISYYYTQERIIQNGLIILPPRETLCAPSAPCAVDIPSEQCQFIGSSGNVPVEHRIAEQFNYYPFTAPVPQIYPQPFMQTSNLDQNLQTQFNVPPFPHGAPPPYPNVLPQIPNEKPPPYAP